MKRVTAPIWVLAATVGIAAPLRAETKVDFNKEILPILKKSCLECHGPDKQKGKLRLDTKAAAFKGGSEGPVLVAGDAAKSELYRRITLPPDHDDIMPNKGEALTKAQTDLIRDWINQGAEWPETAAPAQPPTEEKENQTPAPPSASRLQTPGPQPGDAELKAIEQIEAAGVPVRPLAQNVNWREANFRPQSTNVTDATLAPLKELTTLFALNLAGTKITDAGLENLKNLPNLTRLHLENTAITDAGLGHLKGLTNLEYLNLYGTAVSDAGLDQLKTLTHLRKLYLWQTKVTEEGAADLQKAIPALEISRGWELKGVAKSEKVAEAKAESK